LKFSNSHLSFFIKYPGGLRFGSLYYIGERSHSKIPKWARITITINEAANITAAVGDILTPIEESSKNLIRPAPEDGIGAEPALRLLLLDLLDIFVK
jgi:hypothetical protein